MRHPDLRTFVDGYFSKIGASRHEDVPGVIRFEIPPDRRNALNNSSLRITFDPAIAERYEGVELLTPGSLLLDRILEDASSRGHHCAAKVDVKESPPPQEVLTANLTFRRATAKIASSSRELVPYLLFTFRVSLATDEKTELLESILICSASLLEHQVGDLFFDEALTLPETPLPGERDLKTVYAAACEALENRISGVVAECRDNAAKRQDGEDQRIKEYFAGLLREAKESRHPDHAEAAIAAYVAEEKKRLEEVRLKYRLEAEVKLVGIRTIFVPTVKMTLRIQGGKNGQDIGLEYDEVSLEIPPPKCQGCGSDMKDIGICDEGHVACHRCEQRCTYCDRISCPACEEGLRLSQTCAQCSRLLCSSHAIRDDFGLGIYCPEHIAVCPSCGRKASGSFVARCEKCNQRYCFLCVTAKQRTCNTCRSLNASAEDDADVARVKAQSTFSGKYGKWKKAANEKFTIVEGRSMLARRTFVLDKEGRLVWEG